MNVTLSVDDRVVAEARRISAVRGTSLNQIVRDFLNELTRVDEVESVVAQLNALWAEEDYRSEGPWTREELRSCRSSPIFAQRLFEPAQVGSREPRSQFLGMMPGSSEQVEVLDPSDEPGRTLAAINRPRTW